MVSLYKQLDDALVSCQLEDSARNSSFLPVSELDKVTCGSIKAELTFVTKLCFPGLPNRVVFKAKRVFAILVLIQEPGAIRGLINEGITDEDLPLCRNGDRGDSEYNVLASPGNSKRFPSSKTWPKECRVRDFLEKQWMVQSPIFDKLGSHFVLDWECPLPLIECDTEEAKGGMGVVHKAKLHPAHQRVFQPDFESFIAIKEIKDVDVFNKEKHNLNIIQELKNKHLIKLIASCEKGSIYYLLFPWADGGTLRDFWKFEDTRPRTPNLNLWALRQMLGLVDGIKALHDRNIRHGDIKPQNVLVFKEFGGLSQSQEELLVLADVGVSKIHKEATRLRESATTTTDVTISYEAPEAESDRRDNRPRPRRYDMWSAGCMFLEFTTWLAYNWRAVRSFRKQRTTIDDTTIKGNFFTRKSKGSGEIHSAVSDAIRHLREHPSCKSGTALGDLITLIEDRLLRIQPEERAKAPELYNRLKLIVDSASDPEYLGHEPNPPPAIPPFFNLTGSRQNSTSESGSSLPSH